MARNAYQVPALDGGFLKATPLKFCLKYKPPTLALVYHIEGNPKKSVREFPLNLQPDSDLEKVCADLCERESVYFNFDKMSKQQVLNLLKILHQHVYPTSANKENQQQEGKKMSKFEQRLHARYEMPADKQEP